MLSVLIPVYNQDVRELVSELHAQLLACSVPFEIVIADDASDFVSVEDNSSLSDLECVRVINFTKNQGRSKIRNFLAAKAVYPNLIILDCDASVCRDSFIGAYLDFLRKNDLFGKKYAVLGGVAYRNASPDHNFRLRYKYGIRREERPAAVRNLNPYKAFTPFNLLIAKSVFETCRFDESLNQYGYEDTFFGIELKNNGIPVYHIDNQMFHDGLDSDETFLGKVEKSCQNLKILMDEGKINEDFVSCSNLLITYNKLKSSALGRLLLGGLAKNSGILRSTTLKFCSLGALDLYKLSLVVKLNI